MTISPDLEEYRYLARSILTRGEYAFRDDWRNNPVLADSPWRFLYDDSGMVRPPGYPLFIAAVEGVFGASDSALQAALLLVDGFSTILIARIAGTIFGGASAWIAGALFALNPISIQCVNLRTREGLIVFLTASGVYLLLKYVSLDDARLAALAGLFFGLGALIKETTIIAGLVGVVWLAAVGPRGTRRAVGLGLMILSMTLPTTVWVIRNSLHHGRLVGMSTLGGLNIWYGLVQREPIRGLYPSGPIVDVAELDPRQASNGVDADQRLLELVRRHVAEEPAHVLGRVVRNIGLFWSPVSRTILAEGFQTRRVEIVSVLYFALVLPLFIVALWQERSRLETMLVIAVVLVLTVMHGMFDSAPRFRMTLEVFIATFAARPLRRFLLLLKRRGRLVLSA